MYEYPLEKYGFAVFAGKSEANPTGERRKQSGEPLL